MSFIITTAIKSTQLLQDDAKQCAKGFNVPYISRQKMTIKQINQAYGDCLVFYKDKIVYHFKQGETLCFHPNTAIVRIKSQTDPLLQLVGTHKRILDCSLGLAGDSIVMAYGQNTVVALEKNAIIYFIVKRGLQRYCHSDECITKAMRTIEVNYGDCLEFLKTQPDNAFDIVYFDPMFLYHIEESTNINGVKQLEAYTPLTQQWVNEAKRIAKEKVIIKAHFKDNVFETYGFKRLVRPTIKFHYGVLDNLN